MLRTKRTLVIPAHVNITAITNSYDVIHSWFIPGLGLKMDCIPGRSTHHTFYVDNVGFYYGQCAEVCGRYHHHMPIRICALPFDHFLLWWHHFGAPKFIPNNFSKKTSIDYGLRKYSW
jgi:heme/copper-type cytochrome/quinol oxidase subunit 2